MHLFPEIYDTAQPAEDDLPGTYELTSENFPALSGSDTEAPWKSSESNPVSSVSARAVRLSAAQLVQQKIDAYPGVTPALPLILAAFDAVSAGQSDTHLIEQVLRLGGRQYAEGKQVLEIIKRALTITED